MSDRRAQLVLLAAGVVALAMVPVVAAWLQLGYHGDVRADAERTDGDAAESIERTLSVGLHDAIADRPAPDDWENRSSVVETVRSRLSPALHTVRGSRAAAAVTVQYNQSAARRLASDRCPRGPDREFGPCDAVDGVVVQSRYNTTHVVAVTVDVQLVDERRAARATLAVRP